MPLKYQTEIDSFTLDFACPQEVHPPEAQSAYRWAYETKTHPHNFLPNVVWDREKGFHRFYSNSKQKCTRCAASFYTELAYAKNAWQNLCSRMSENLQLDYSHIAYGILNNNDGLMKTPDKSGHFSFYENEGIDLAKTFEIIDTI